MKMVLWFAVIVLALGMTVVGFNSCSKNIDRRLNGTWALDEENPEIAERVRIINVMANARNSIEFHSSMITFKNGNYEYFTSQEGVIKKGTYITNDDNLILHETHFRNRFGDKALLEWEWTPEYPEPASITKTYKYSLIDKKLNIYGGDGFGFGGILRGYDPLVLINVEKNTKAASVDKESVPAKKSSGKVSAFPGRWQLIEGNGDAKNVELFKDGTGTADGNGITWKIENGRFHILHPWYTFSAYYNVTGSTITFTQENGKVIKYQKK